MKYSQQHIWVKKEDKYCILGLSLWGKEQIGNIVFCELPLLGQTLKKEEVFCVVESNKSATDLVSPISGIVVEINENLQKDSNTINNDPEKEGWICTVEPFDETEYENMLEKKDYQKQFTK